MSIFSGRNRAGARPKAAGSQAPAQRAHGGVSSIWGEGSRFEGVARVEGTLRVDGICQGTLEVAETLVIGKPGAFSGDVRARDVIVCGRLHGKITADGSVELQRGCHFEGEVRTRILVIEEGVFFRGQCWMEDGGSGAQESPRLAQVSVDEELDISSNGAPQGGESRVA